MKRMRLMLILLVAPLAARAEVCPPQKLGKVRFARGESLEYKLAALGGEGGRFDLHAGAPPAAERSRAALVVRSRAKTSAFVSTNVKQYDAHAMVLLAADLSPLRYKEDVDEGELHRAQEVDFPPSGGTLSVRATTNRDPDPFTLPAGPGARESLSTPYLLGAPPLEQG